MDSLPLAPLETSKVRVSKMTLLEDIIPNWVYIETGAQEGPKL